MTNTGLGPLEGQMFPQSPTGCCSDPDLCVGGARELDHQKEPTLQEELHPQSMPVDFGVQKC